MSLKTRLQEDIKNAMRTGDHKHRDVLRLISAAVKQIEVDERIDVDDARMLAILDKMLKQRQESIAQFTTAGRIDLVEKEQFEQDVIRHYLPEPLSQADIQRLIQDAIVASEAKSLRDMGKVMTLVKPAMQGRADMSHVSDIIKSLLNA